MRRADIERKTLETSLAVGLDLDGAGRCDAATGIGFLDHMLGQIARHALFDLTVRAEGDRHVDDHHTVEDTGIALGSALAKAMGGKKGIRRYGSATVPMDEALTRASLDLSGRPFLVWRVRFTREKIGAFDTDLVKEFFTAFAMNARMTLHLESLHGENAHHMAEGCFKATARALRTALEIDPRCPNAMPSTKGTL